MPNIIDSTPKNGINSNAGYARVIGSQIHVGNKEIQSLLQYHTALFIGKKTYIFTNIRGEKSMPMTLNQYIEKVLIETQG